MKDKTKFTVFEFFIYAIRHGESVDNQNKIFSGSRNISLTDVGIYQAKKAAYTLQSERIPFKTVITSQLLRSKQTALTFLDQYRKARARFDRFEFICSPDFNERDFGDLEGRSKVVILEKIGKE